MNNVDIGEIKKFDGVADIWWDVNGEMGTLHVINPLRLQFITERLTSPAPKMLDVGCGGGILSEALAKFGAQVTGIDLSQASLNSAAAHAQAGGLNIEYQNIRAEDLARERPAAFDAVTCMEMLEHVPQPQAVIASCAQALKPGGHAFFSSINRTPKAFLFAIVGGEYILRLLPRGTHTYNKLIRPSEIKAWAQKYGLEFLSLASLMYNPFTRKFKVAHGKEDVNYMMRFVKKQ